MAKRGPKPKKPRASAIVGPLRSQNVVVDGRRTSMRLEPTMWEAFEEIAARERMSINDICGEINRRLGVRERLAGGIPDDGDVTLTSAVRTFLVSYFRRAGTEQGHNEAGHGSGDPFSGTPFDDQRLSLSVGGDEGGAADRADGRNEARAASAVG